MDCPAKYPITTGSNNLVVIGYEALFPDVEMTLLPPPVMVIDEPEAVFVSSATNVTEPPPGAHPGIDAPIVKTSPGVPAGSADITLFAEA